MTFTGTKAEISNELKFVKSCIDSLKKIKQWTPQEKKMFYELKSKKKYLEDKLNGFTK